MRTAFAGVVALLFVAASGYSIPPQTGRRWGMRWTSLLGLSMQESVHLKLQEVGSVSSEPPTLGTLRNRTEVVIHEFVSRADNSTLLACVGEKYKLEHFSCHVFGSNYSANASVAYLQTVMDDTNDALVAKYVGLWREGR
ncbi:hypothetical protein B484DRAFT_426057, partial [Ochromonadaceae sp. CCMP2298]